MQCPDKKVATKDKTVKLESDGKAAKKEGEIAGTERMSAKLNGKCDIYFSVDTMASKSVITEGTLAKLRLEMPVPTRG